MSLLQSCDSYHFECRLFERGPFHGATQRPVFGGDQGCLEASLREAWGGLGGYHGTCPDCRWKFSRIVEIKPCGRNGLGPNEPMCPPPRSRSEPGSPGQCCGRHPLPSAGVELPDGVWLWAEGRLPGSSVHHVWRVSGGGGRWHGEHEQGRHSDTLTDWTRRLLDTCSRQSALYVQAPHMLHMRAGVKMGDAVLQDSMVSDGLTDAFHHYHMGITGRNKVK